MTVNSNVPFLAEATIVPEDKDLFIPYFNQLYGDIVTAVNTRDSSYFVMSITNTAANIPNLANYGAFIICVSGQASTLPSLTAAVNKASATAAGVVTPLSSQAGTAAPWAAATLTISSTTTNFQIAHSVAGVTGNFNVRIIGTQ